MSANRQRRLGNGISWNAPTHSPSTLAEYRRLLDKRIIPRLGQRRVRELRAADLDLFYADLIRKGGAPVKTVSGRLGHANASTVTGGR